MSAAKPFLLLQISDTHIGADWQGIDPEPNLRAVLDAIEALPQRPDALLVTGDLTQNGAPEEYARLREMLAPLGLEPHVIPGNHDRRETLRAAFGLPGAGEEHVSSAVERGPLRVICLDSIIPGSEAGALDGGRLEWLDEELAADHEAPTVLPPHRPPLLTQVPAFDAIGLADIDREALGALLARHPQVLRVVAGHVHRPIATELAGRPVLSIPSTYLQSVLDFASPRIGMRADPPGYAVHAFREGVLTSHVQTVAPQ